MSLWLTMLLLLASPFNLQNGDFRAQQDGKPIGWQTGGTCRLIPNGGKDEMPAMEIESDGKDRSYAQQVLSFAPARSGDFVVSAWVRCDDLQDGGDCSVWLDVLQQDGPPLWGIRGFPVAQRKGWQLVKSIVKPIKPVKQVDLYLMLEKRGRVRFCDVRIEDLPFTVDSFAVRPGTPGSCDVRASLSAPVQWKLSAERSGTEIWNKAGEGSIITDQFSAPGSVPVTVTLQAERNGRVKTLTRQVTPRTDSSPDWWVENSLTRVFQEDILPGKPIRRAALDMARNEYESFQICLRALSDPLKQVKVGVSDLKCGISTIPASSIKWSRVGYFFVKTPYPSPCIPQKENTWWPEPLLNAGNFDVEAGRTQPLWFTVRTSESTTPGTYTGAISVQADGMSPLTVPVSVKVYPTTIPIQGKMKTTFALMDGYINRIYGSIPRDLRRAYTDIMLDHRLNPDDITRTALPDIEELKYANTRGLNAFCILNVVPEPGHSEVPMPEWPTLWTCWAPVGAYTPKFKKEFFERLDAIVPELERNGLIDKAYIYGFDERGPEYIPIMKEFFAEIKRRYPRVHTLTTCLPTTAGDPLSLNIDHYVPLSPAYDHKLAQDVRKRGGEVWWYVCMGPKYPYANIMLDNPLVESRLIWWQAFSYDVEGMLFWAVNLWDYANNDKLIPDSAGPRLDWSVTAGGDIMLNGDGVLLYPGEHGPLGGLRLENIRDGLEDTEILRQYRERFGETAARSILSNVTTDRTHFSRDPKDLVSSRVKMLKALAR